MTSRPGRPSPPSSTGPTRRRTPGNQAPPRTPRPPRPPTTSRRERDPDAPEDPRRGPPRNPGAVRLLRLGPEHRRRGAGPVLLYRRRLVRAPAAGHLPRPRADQDPAQPPL